METLYSQPFGKPSVHQVKCYISDGRIPTYPYKFSSFCGSCLRIFTSLYNTKRKPPYPFSVCKDSYRMVIDIITKYLLICGETIQILKLFLRQFRCFGVLRSLLINIFVFRSHFNPLEHVMDPPISYGFDSRQAIRHSSPLCLH